MASKDLSPWDIPRHRDAGELLVPVLTRRFRRYTKPSSGPHESHKRSQKILLAAPMIVTAHSLDEGGTFVPLYLFSKYSQKLGRGDKLRIAKGIFIHDRDSSRGFAHGTAEAAVGGIFSCGGSQIQCLGPSKAIGTTNMIYIYIYYI